MIPHKPYFAWWPVKIAEFDFDGVRWEYTGKRAWLRWVMRVETMWGQVFYKEKEERHDQEA